ncbi:hypothetical protein ACVXZZ_07575 [Staphylococcus aureus]
MPSLQKVENVEMIAFCDVDISKAASAAEAYGTTMQRFMMITKHC